MIYRYSAGPEKVEDHRFPPLLSTVSKQLREECLPLFCKGVQLDIDWRRSRSSLSTPMNAEVSIELYCSFGSVDMFSRQATPLDDLPDVFTHIEAVTLTFDCSYVFWGGYLTLNLPSLCDTKTPATFKTISFFGSEPEREFEPTLCAALHGELNSSIKRATCLGKPVAFSLELCKRLTVHIGRCLSRITLEIDDDDDIIQGESDEKTLTIKRQ